MNNNLINELTLLVAKENQVTLEILVLLNKLENSIIYKELGYSTLFSYLTKGLKYSEPAASRRLRSARCIKQYPEVEKMFKRQEVNLTTVSMFASILTEENKEELLESVKNKTKTEVEQVLSAYKPQTFVTERIKAVSIKKKSAPSQKTELKQVVTEHYGHCGSEEVLVSNPEQIVTEQRYELKFSVSQESMDKYGQVKSLMSSKYAAGIKIEDMFNELLDNYLKNKAPKARKIKNSKKKTNSRYISKAIKNRVYLRDGGKCCYEGTEGVKCNSTWDLEIDHIKPYSLGGSNEEDNLRLLCRAHNHMRAAQTFGER